MEDGNLKYITIGIRHRRSFGIADKSGEVIDFILRDNSSPFSPEFFPVTYETRAGGRILANDETGETLSVDADSVILKMKAEDLSRSYKLLQDRYVPFIQRIFKDFSISNMNRIGIVFDYTASELKALNENLRKFTKEEVVRPASVQLRFSGKLPAQEAEYKKGIVDFVNVIYTFVTDAEDKRARATMDYQLLFEPEIASINDVPISMFLSQARSYFEEKFLVMLKYEKGDQTQ